MKACCTQESVPTVAPAQTNRIALVGQPNCGKTTLFNRLTGTHQATGNWPGVTVERKTGVADLGDGVRVTVIDLPGVYSLVPDRLSGLDEAVVRAFFVHETVDLVVNVVDATQLERHLGLTLQLLSMGLPVVVALNRVDRLAKMGLTIDTAALEARLGCPVVAVCAYRNQGIDRLRHRLRATLGTQTNRWVHEWPEPLHRAIATLRRQHLETQRATSVSSQAVSDWQVLGWLLDPASAPAGLREKASASRTRIEADTGESLPLVLSSAFASCAERIAAAVEHRSPQELATWTERIDHWVLHPRWGLPLFFLILYTVFAMAVHLGNALQPAFEGTAQALFVDGVRALLVAWGAPSWLVVFLADGVGGGIQVVAGFIPVIAALFLFLSLLEESGYMQRVAVLMDRAFSRLGLSGQTFVPLVVGMGCNVPAVMACRTLPDARDRLVTVVMAPFMSCSARLTVYTLFAAAFFPHQGALVIFALYLLGIAAAVLTAWLFRGAMRSEMAKALVLELPDYHRPSLLNLALNIRHKLKGFVIDAGRVIVAIVVVLQMVSAVGTDGTFGEPNRPDSVLSAVGHGLTPALEPIGVQEDNWPATVGLFTGLLAKEVVVGTLDALYRGEASAQDSAVAPPVTSLSDVIAALRSAWGTVPGYFSSLGGAILDPLGLHAALGDQGAALDVHHETLTHLRDQFTSPAAVFAYLVFVLLYFPCTATLAAIARELGWRWALFSGAWSLTLAYSLATLTYQAGDVLFREPVPALLRVGVVVLVLTAVVRILQRVAAHWTVAPDQVGGSSPGVALSCVGCSARCAVRPDAGAVVEPTPTGAPAIEAKSRAFEDAVAFRVGPGMR